MKKLWSKICFWNKEEAEVPKKIIYRHKLRIFYSQSNFDEIWYDLDDELRTSNEVFGDFIDWYTLKPNKQFYTFEAPSFIDIIDRTKIFRVRITNYKVMK